MPARGVRAVRAGFRRGGVSGRARHAGRDSAFARKGLLNGLARADSGVVAVGQRGHVLYSDDGGRTWTQAKVPVSSDLVAVAFPTPSHGWAVGHDGVVLHSADAGATWIRQLDAPAGDGRRVRRRRERRVGRRGEGAGRGEALRRAGRGNPFLDVWFENERTGFVVGAFNLILRTTDGGKTWEPWLHRTDTRRRCISTRSAGGGALYIAGEQGLLLKLDAAEGGSARSRLPYQGTLFGVTGSAKSAVVFGLRVTRSAAPTAARPGTRSRPASRSGLTGGAVDAGRLVLVEPGGPRPRQRRRRRDLQAAQGSSGRRRRRRSSAPKMSSSSRPARRTRAAAELAGRATMAIGTDSLDRMPVVRDLADFDRNSGSRLERLIFNNRLVVVASAAA